MTFMKNKYFFSIVLIIAFSGCSFVSSDEEKIETGLIGTWELKSAEGDYLIFQRRENLPNQNYGFTLKEDHTIVERAIVGWCATPPVTYTNYFGDWIANDSENDLLVRVDGYWNGSITYKMLIAEVNETTLKIRKEYLQ